MCVFSSFNKLIPQVLNLSLPIPCELDLPIIDHLSVHLLSITMSNYLPSIYLSLSIHDY